MRRPKAVPLKSKNTKGPFRRYSRESLIDLMEHSVVVPRLKKSVFMLLSNSASSNLLADTVFRESSTTELTDSLVRKCSSVTFSCAAQSSCSNLLTKSVSFDDSSNGCNGDGQWNQVGTGQKAMRTFRSCLNKLTADNFEAVLAEVKQMRVGDDETILSFIELLYEKAILEPTYAAHYVKLTMALKNIFTIGIGKKSFEHFAIVACQRGFEDAMGKLHEVKHMCEEAKDKLRHGLSGSIQFIAKMYLNRVLNRRIIIQICEELLSLECSESIEPLCKLLEISGAALENELPKDEKLVSIMKKLSCIANKFPTRIKFMIQNLADQRRDGWKPRFCKDGPKKLEQVANECGFVKRAGATGRYDEVEAKPDAPQPRMMTRHEHLNRDNNFGNRDNSFANRGGHFRGNRGRSFRGGRRGGKPFVNRNS